MSSYKISVKTGDKKGAGTDANVYIILHGKGTKTDSYNLDTFLQGQLHSSIAKPRSDSILHVGDCRVRLFFSGGGRGVQISFPGRQKLNLKYG
jgi:hypothetical protein